MKISKLCSTDDMILRKELKNINMKINAAKTKTKFGSKERQHRILLEEDANEEVTKFKYLGATVNSRRTLHDERLAATERLYNAIKTNFLRRKEKQTTTKDEVVKKLRKRFQIPVNLSR